MATAQRDMFDPQDVTNPNMGLALFRKIFVKGIKLDKLLSHIVKEQGMRCYQTKPSWSSSILMMTLVSRLRCVYVYAKFFRVTDPDLVPMQKEA
jgi:hypothetical protein